MVSSFKPMSEYMIWAVRHGGMFPRDFSTIFWPAIFVLHTYPCYHRLRSPVGTTSVEDMHRSVSTHAVHILEKHTSFPVQSWHRISFFFTAPIPHEKVHFSGASKHDRQALGWESAWKCFGAVDLKKYGTLEHCSRKEGWNFHTTKERLVPEVNPAYLICVYATDNEHMCASRAPRRSSKNHSQWN